MIVLIGFMGAGKTTVGHLLAEKLGLPFVDSDLIIESRTGRSVREIFAADGEPAFRELEQQITAELLRGQDAVLALGGGGAEHPATRDELKGSQVVYLQVGYDEAMLRVSHDEYRPMLRAPDLHAIFERRLAVYESVATETVATAGRRPEAICLDIIERLVQVPCAPPGTTSVLVACTGGTYNVHVGSGLLPELDRLLPPLPHARTAVLLAAGHDSDPVASASAALQRTGLDVRYIQVPDRQQSKDLATIAEIAGELAGLAVHKDDVIVGVGGEVVGDIAGFLASTYNRGMPLVLLPTTLAAQADAAVGGKASLNLPQGRNLVGTVHQPVAVVADVTLAAERRSREYQAGLAEIVKHALISGPDMVALVDAHSRDLLNGDVATLAQVVARSVAVKAEIVSNDEREQGDRLHLNYGHTFGHAIEQARGLDSGDDGDAIAVGMMAAAYLARRQRRIPDDLVGLHRRLLTGLGLPTQGSFELAELRDAWLRDKKYHDGARFVVLNGLGRPEAGIPADEATLEAVLADLAEPAAVGHS
jgi:shikimate kinase / 3-dehydroquinate synthase